MSSTTAAYDHITPNRPSHRLHRSITEISSSPRKSHHHHIHRTSQHQNQQQLSQPTTSRRARSSEKDRGRDGDSQNAHPNLQSFIGGETRWREGVRTEHGTPADSVNGSRSRGGSVYDLDGTGHEKKMMRKRVVKESEVKEEKEKGVLRAKHLHNSIVTLHTHSNEASRNLDSTYYSVLEKLSILNASISSLKDLALHARSIHTDFQSESTNLTSDISSQLENFNNFNTQETRIQELAQRVRDGREKMTALGKRAEEVRTRVESWERAEREWQDKTRRRLRIMWIVISVLGGLVVGLVVFRYTPARTVGSGSSGFDVEELRGKMGPGGENFTFGLQREERDRGRVLERLKQGGRGEERGEEDQRLRVFDEL